MAYIGALRGSLTPVLYITMVGEAPSKDRCAQKSVHSWSLDPGLCGPRPDLIMVT